MDKKKDKNNIIIRLQNIKEAALEITNTKYRYALLLLLARINDCIDGITLEKLIYLQIVASDLNNIYEEYGVTEETLDYIYSETNQLLDIYEKEKNEYGRR